MRRLLVRALGALSLGVLLAAGVGATAASADSTPSTTTSTSAAHGTYSPNSIDWWT